MHRLPNYARRVEYLETTGTQWIDTGVVPRNYPSFRADIGVINAVVSTYNLAISFGCQNAWNSGAYAFVLPANSNNRYCMHDAAEGATRERVTTSLVAETGRILVEHRNGTLSITQGGVHRQYSAPSYENYNELSFMLFRNNGGTAGGRLYPGPYRLYGFSLSISGTPVRSFVPCRVGQTGYLWDEVTGAFFGNSGTGNFVLGTDIAGGGYHGMPSSLHPLGGRRE